VLVVGEEQHAALEVRVEEAAMLRVGDSERPTGGAGGSAISPARGRCCPDEDRERRGRKTREWREAWGLAAASRVSPASSPWRLSCEAVSHEEP
jgi:hypothetical protein